MRMPHIGQQLHIFAYLIVIFFLGTAELEVDNNPFLTVGHHAVWASLYDGIILYRKDRTLIEVDEIRSRISIVFIGIFLA